MENKQVLQSYKLTTIRDKFGLHAQRLIVNIASQMQYRIEGMKFSDIDTMKYNKENRIFKVNIRDLMSEGDNKNTALVKNILDETIKAYISYDRINDKGQKEWVRTTFFEEIYWTHGKSEIGVKITESMWTIFAEFSKGFRKYELECAMKLKSTYSLRLYQLISNVEIPIEYKIEELRLMFGIEQNKYKLTKDFVKYVIERAKNELDEKAPYTYNYRLLGERIEGKKGRTKIDRIIFYPHKNRRYDIVNSDDKELIQRYASGMISRPMKEILIHKYNFTETEIKNNIELLFKAEMEIENILDFLIEKAPQALRKNNPKGYIIATLKAEIEE